MTRVLVVDDDATIRSVMAELLECEGYVVDTAADGVHALERVRDAQPAAILLDLMMPVLDGWGFVDACRQQRICLDVPVVVMSAAHGLQEITSQLKQLGVRAVLAKPFDLVELIALMKHYAPLAG